MTDKQITKADLMQFNGTEKYYKHSFSKVLYTDGVQYLAEKAGAYWLIDAIAFSQLEPPVKAEPFQFWKLMVDFRDNTALLVCEDGNSTTVYEQKIEYTDFPLNEVKFYLTDSVLMLTNEY